MKDTISVSVTKKERVGNIPAQNHNFTHFFPVTYRWTLTFCMVTSSFSLRTGIAPAVDDPKPDILALGLILSSRNLVLSSRNLILSSRNLVLSSRNLILSSRNLVLSSQTHREEKQMETMMLPPCIETRN